MRRFAMIIGLGALSALLMGTAPVFTGARVNGSGKITNANGVTGRWSIDGGLDVAGPVAFGGVPLAVASPLNLFVDANTGDDSSPCTGALGTATACKSIPAAYLKVARWPGARTVITAGPQTFDGGAYLENLVPWYTQTNTVAPSATGSPIVILQGTMLDAGVATGAQTGTVSAATAGGTIAGGGPGTWGTLTFNQATGWTTNDLNKFQVCITAGTGLGQCRQISSNDAGTLAIDGRWVTTPTGASTFSIYDWGTTVLPVLAREQGAWGNNVWPNVSGSGNAAFFYKGNASSFTPMVAIRNFAVTSNNGAGIVSAEGPGFVLAQGNKFTNSTTNTVATAVFQFDQGASGVVEGNYVNTSNTQRIVRVGSMDQNAALPSGQSAVWVNWNRFVMSSGTRGVQAAGANIASIQNDYVAGDRAIYLGTGVSGLSAGDHFSGSAATASISANLGYATLGNISLSIDGDVFDGNSATPAALDIGFAASCVFAFGNDASTINAYLTPYRMRGYGGFINGTGAAIPTPTNSVTADISILTGSGTVTHPFSDLSGASPKVLLDSTTGNKILDQ